jgi:hypothetical protein
MNCFDGNIIEGDCGGCPGVPNVLDEPIVLEKGDIYAKCIDLRS